MVKVFHVLTDVRATFAKTPPYFSMLFSYRGYGPRALATADTTSWGNVTLRPVYTGDFCGDFSHSDACD